MMQDDLDPTAHEYQPADAYVHDMTYCQQCGMEPELHTNENLPPDQALNRLPREQAPRLPGLE